MTLKQWLAAGMLASAPLAGYAQQATEPRGPADASAAVPALHYESAFDAYRRADSAQNPSPDKTWRTANDEVAKPGGHVEHAPSKEAAAPPPAKPAPVDHSKHH